MTEPVIINKFGKLTGWNDMKFAPLGKLLYGVTEVTYDDTVEMEYAHGAGNMPAGYEEKNYTANASVVLYVEEVMALENSLQPGQRLQDIASFDFPVIYDMNGTIRTDVIHNCKFKNNGREWKQNEGKMTKKFDLITSHITWNKR
jgi:hypothetical protein